MKPEGWPAILTFAGTWAAPGTGFPSDIARGCADVAEEIPVQGPNSFGPIPPGDFRAPSYEESVVISADWAINWTISNSNRPVIPIGYSQGGEAASRYRMEFEDGGRLAHFRANFVCGVALGNPSRHYQTTYYGGPETPWEGIALYRLPQQGNEWCELIEPGDLYGTCARGLTGEIERDVYTMCTQMEMHSGAVEFARTFAANCVEIAQNLDGDAFDDAVANSEYVDPSAVAGAELLPPEQLTAEEDKILSVKGISAAIAAAIDGLIFFCSPPFPTAAHCEYHIREVWPGMTYVGLGIQHVHDWVRSYQGAQ